VRDHAAMLLPLSRAAALSGREREVVALIAEGMSSAGIAQRVVLSPLTVKTHASHA
jgi:ATP/maltotriose-dependent transcriptional regulator MalT